MRTSASLNPKPTREQKKAATKERLLSVGADLVLANGFHGTSMDAIAAEAGLTKGAVYSNFGSKAEFLMEIAERILPDQPTPQTGGDFAVRFADSVVAQAHDNLDYWRRLTEFVVYMGGDPSLRDLQRKRRFPDGVGDMIPGSALWQSAALESAIAGLLAMRLIYGAEWITDDLIRWTIDRLQADPASTDGSSQPRTETASVRSNRGSTSRRTSTKTSPRRT